MALLLQSIRVLLLGMVACFLGVALPTTSASAECFPMNSEQERMPVQTNQDPVARLLASSTSCPTDVFSFRKLLVTEGATIQTSLVNNQGFHNPDRANFSLFEMVSGSLPRLALKVDPGQFFFGHFTASKNGTLFANQTPKNLMVELIAWDAAKEQFNFYELMGNGQKGEWFYRGDSQDIAADISLLHRQHNPQNPEFGSRLRCSGCHMAGGPIMKELASPHNDWWTTARHLSFFGDLQLDAQLAEILKGLVDGDELAKSVAAGASLLETSAKLREAQHALSLQEQLRPLFCPVELNLESDVAPFDAQQSMFTVPSAFFVDPRLAQAALRISRTHYEAALTRLESHFPGTQPLRRDADHAWLTPVKASSDIRAIDRLISKKVIDQEFVSAVLGVDLTNPAFSSKRCGLLRLVPSEATGDWMGSFQGALKASTEPAAQELLRNLTDPERRSVEFEQNRAAQLLHKCQSRLSDSAAVVDFVRLLAERRAAVYESEISRNPKGQILEPRRLSGGHIDVESGFKVVFPVVPSVQPFKARPMVQLTEECEVVSH
jgi:hypothetical protein